MSIKSCANNGTFKKSIFQGALWTSFPPGRFIPPSVRSATPTGWPKARSISQDLPLASGKKLILHLIFLPQELYQSFLLMARQIGFEVRPLWEPKNLSPAIQSGFLFFVKQLLILSIYG